MGGDPRSAALDSRLRVRGAQGLRVVDASAFPNVTSGNTNTPTIMLAERGADLILQDSRAPPG
jgi:choline dehydrogenase